MSSKKDFIFFEKYKNFINKLIVENLNISEYNNTNYEKTIESYIHPKKPDEIIRKKIIDGYIEIIDTYDSLKDSVIYLSNFFYKSTQITKSRYLSYHFENYLNELYILKNRLISYLNILKKIYLKSMITNVVDRKIDSLKTDIHKSFEMIDKVRGDHVHQKRFSDANIASLSALEIIIENDGNEEQEDVYNQKYNDVKEEMIIIAKSINKILEFFLHVYFKKILELITDNNDLLIHPDNK